MKKINIIFILLVCSLSCKDPFEDSTYTAFEELPAAAYMKANPEEFSMWVEMLERANLFHTLNLQRVYTCFVPSNAAVQEYLDNAGVSSVQDLEESVAATLVRYHLIPGVKFDQSQFQNGVIPNPTATEDNLTIEFREGGLNAIYLNEVARIEQIDIQVTNGVIHRIDRVLIPITESVFEILQESGRYTLFTEAVTATGYAEELNTISIETTNDEGQPIIKRFRFTAFAVSDSIYSLAGISSLSELAEMAGSTSTNYTNADNELNKYVAYHLLSQLKSFADLAVFPQDEITTNINTMAENELISLTDVSGTLTINLDTTTQEGITFVQENINCKNGVIHEVDSWMPVFTPPRVSVQWDLADYPDLAAVCEKYQLSNLTSTYTRTLSEGEVTSYTWKGVPESRTAIVAYRNNRGNDGAYYSTLNYDHIRFQPGPSGWVELQTPVLIKGDYRITLFYVSPNSSSDTGRMFCSMDGVALGGQITIYNTSSTQLRQVELDNSFTFDETTSHTLRVVSVDDDLLPLDYILFEPID